MLFYFILLELWPFKMLLIRCIKIFAVWSHFFEEYKISFGLVNMLLADFFEEFGFDLARHRGCREMIE